MRRNFSKAEYEEYLKSSEWQTKRRRKAKEQNHICEICHKKVLKGFHIHHKTYIRFKKERLSDLMFLCEDCHTKLHSAENKHKKKQIKYTNTFKCFNCNSEVFIIKQKVSVTGLRRGLYCAKCGRFYDFLVR